MLQVSISLSEFLGQVEHEARDNETRADQGDITVQAFEEVVESASEEPVEEETYEESYDETYEESAETSESESEEEPRSEDFGDTIIYTAPKEDKSYEDTGILSLDPAKTIELDDVLSKVMARNEENFADDEKAGTDFLIQEDEEPVSKFSTAVNVIINILYTFALSLVISSISHYRISSNMVYYSSLRICTMLIVVSHQ